MFRTLFCSATYYLRGEAPEQTRPSSCRRHPPRIDQCRGRYFICLFEINLLTTVRFSKVMFDEAIFPEVKRITGTFASHTNRYSPSVAQQADRQSPQRSVVPSSATAGDDTETTSVQPPALTSQLPPTADGTPPPPANSSTNGPRSRRLRSSGCTPDLRGLLATVLHATDFNDDDLPL
eukprot:1041855-Pleurochrysis_carterae.AAC.1